MAHDGDFIVFRQVFLGLFPGFFQGSCRDEAAVADDVEVFRPRDDVSFFQGPEDTVRFEGDEGRDGKVGPQVP